jgi:hypothetical protein
VALGLDDCLLLGALFFLFVSIGIQFACKTFTAMFQRNILITLGVLAGGVGRHIEDVDPLDVVKTLKVCGDDIPTNNTANSRVAYPAI